MSFITLTEAKDRLRVTVDTSDAVIEQLIDEACALVERTTGRRYDLPLQTEEPEYFDGSGTPFLRLPQSPTPGEPSPVVEHDPGAGEWEVVADTEYQIVEDQLKHHIGWQFGKSNYRITYTTGHAESSTAIEYQLARKAAFDLVNQYWQARATSGFESETIGKYSYKVASSDTSQSVPESLKQLRGLVYA